MDQNYMYVDYPTLIKKNKLNGFASTIPTKKTVAEIAKEVIQGKWGVGADRKQRLTAAGYDYSAVQAEVNRMLK